MADVSEIKDQQGNVISTLHHPDSGLDEQQLQHQVRAARMRTDLLVAERIELAKRLVQHVPSSGDDRFTCLCGEPCASATDWATHAALQVLLPA